MKMYIYTITHDDFGYDCYHGHTIVAENIPQAVKLAKDKAADEGKDVWSGAGVQDHGVYTGANKEPFILMSDYNAG